MGLSPVRVSVRLFSSKDTRHRLRAYPTAAQPHFHWLYLQSPLFPDKVAHNPEALGEREF